MSRILGKYLSSHLKNMPDAKHCDKKMKEVNPLHDKIPSRLTTNLFYKNSLHILFKLAAETSELFQNVCETFEISLFSAVLLILMKCIGVHNCVQST